MRRIVWNEEKSKLLRSDTSRGGIGLEECAAAIENGDVLANMPHPSDRYLHQWIYVLRINNYAYVVPYVGNAEEIFLKTFYPSRTYTKFYLEAKGNE